MKKLLLLIFGVALAGCSTINVTVSGNDNNLTIEQPKSVTTSPAASGNTIPLLK